MSLFGGLGCQEHKHIAAFQLGGLFHHRYLRARVGKALHGFESNFGMTHFAATETDGNLYLVAALKELNGVLGFGLGGNGTIFMKVVLSGVPAGQAGAGTGTYGLFRDLAAPFGVAVFVPLFTNQITSKIATGTAASAAAVSSIHFLAIAEILCVALGAVAVALLPKTKKEH